MYYLCKSRRHVICKDCNDGESIKNRNDDGDNIIDEERDTSGAKEISYILSSKKQPQNFASGDHIEAVESYKITLSKTGVTKSSSNNQGTNNVETTVKYINNNYNESQSSIASSNILLTKSTSKQDQNFERATRPVRCPITNCSRMVIITSFLKHFNFDHSRVPKIVLGKTEPQEILITYTTISSETNCLAILVIPHETSCRSNQRSTKNTESLRNLSGLGTSDELHFLMATKLEISPVKQYGTRYGSTKNQHTQTGHTQRKNKQNKLSLAISLIQKADSENMENVPNIPYSDNKDVVILLWLCSLDNKENIFTVTVSRTDRKRGYSFIGSGVPIKEQQDPLSIYNRQECLSVREIAVDKLVSNNELKVLVALHNKS